MEENTRDQSSVTPATTRLAINEIQASPADGESDWLELTVVGDGTVALEDYSLVDENPDHEAITLPAGSLAAGEFLVVPASREPLEGVEFQLPFGLGGADSLTLGVAGSAVDELAWSGDDIPNDASWGRLPDGNGDAVALTPTPGAANRAFQGPGPDSELFPRDRVVEVHIELEEQAWQAILDDPTAEEYQPAHLIFDGIRVENVAVRTKGNSSLTSVARDGDSDRFSFKVDINRLVEDQELLGAKKLNFNNGFKDPSLIREHLAYRLMEEAGLPAAQTAFVDLYVAGEHMGLYTMVEHVDAAFLKRHFDDNDGDLYKPDPPAGNLGYLGDRIDDYRGFEPERNEETSDHQAFLTLMDTLNNGDVEQLSSVLDLDNVLLYLATSTALVNLDSYLGMGHNFFLYEQEGVFSIIPWDLNEAFGNFSCGCDRDGLINLYIDEPTCGSVRDKPLVNRPFSVPAHLERYHQHLRALIDGPLSTGTMEARIQATADLIRPYVEADTRKFYSTADFERSLTTDVGGNRGAAIGLATFVAERRESIRQQLAGERPASNDGQGSCGRQGGPGGGEGPGRPGGGAEHPCGDGRCDDFEQNNPDACPRDCGEEPPENGDWCGDGHCDARERHTGECPEDC